jgi:membrane-associated phospholipid phosphatase
MNLSTVAPHAMFGLGSNKRPSREPSAGIASALALLVWLATAASAAADDPDLRLRPQLSRFTTTQYALTAAMAVSLLASHALIEPASQARWQGGIFLDDDARSMLAARSKAGRRIAASASDVLSLGLVLYPFAIDALFVTGIIHHDIGLATQLGLIGLQSVLLTALVTDLTKDLVGRARPDAELCAAGEESACGSTNRSFLSGHTSSAFVGAGLICANHQNLKLYGDGPGGAIACGLSLSAATVAGTLRIVADRHHMTDVLAGAALGLAAGYLLPNLTNFDFGKSRDESNGVVTPMLGNGTFGLTYSGTF